MAKCLLNLLYIEKICQQRCFPIHYINISAGFDAHREDTLGGMELVESDYEWITRQIVEVTQKYANGHIVSFLEGGYNLSPLARSAVAHIRILAGLG